MVDDSLKEWTSDASNMFDSINNFVEKSTGVAGTFSQLYPEVSGSENDITITKDNPFSEYYGLSDITPGIHSFELNFEITDEQDDLYIIANCNGITKIRIYVDGVEQNYERLQYQTYHVGHLSRGAKVGVEYYFSDGVPENTSARLTIATLNSDAFSQAYARWSDEQMNVSKFEDGYVKGHISVQEDGLMFTSIPYDAGWTAYVDGEKTDIQTVAGAFIALDLKAGDHTVEFKYFPVGLKTGLILTFAAWLIFALLQSRRGKASKVKQQEKNMECDDSTSLEMGEGNTSQEMDEDNTSQEMDEDSASLEMDSAEDQTEDDEYDFESDRSRLEAAIAYAEKIRKNKQNNENKKSTE